METEIKYIFLKISTTVTNTDVLRENQIRLELFIYCHVNPGTGSFFKSVSVLFVI